MMFLGTLIITIIMIIALVLGLAVIFDDDYDD